ISTPPASHPEIAGAFLERGTPVLCEKPLAIDERSARAMVDASHRSGTLLTMASKFRFVADVFQVREMILSGELGDIFLVENAFNSPVQMADRWNSKPELSGGGVLIDNGTHSVDIVRYLLGPISEVLAFADVIDKGLSVEDNAQLFLKTKAGTEARVDLSWSFDKQLPNFVSVYGSKGTAHIGWKESKVNTHTSGGWKVFGNGYNKLDAFRANVANFAAAIDGAEPARVTVYDAMASVEVISAAYASVNSGNRWQAVDGGGGDAAPDKQKELAVPEL
ncbi:MAG: Gfo/Idh/MocA family oxidoreductase, partial [Pseudomonadota bacterium]